MSSTAIPEEIHKTRVLLVDDNRAFLKIAAEFLGRTPELALVGTLSQGKEALARVQVLQPHVVVVDMDMPDISGLELIGCLRSELPQVGIIALTLLSGEAYRGAVLGAGADDFVSKTALVTDLLPAIRRVVKAARAR